MRNFKKVLSLVLCMAMMLSVMVVGAGAAFSDQSKIKNTEAVDMCSALNIINGYTDGSFKPEGTITRAEACKMICVALNGGKEPVLGTNATATFTDIKGHWAEGYIEYCVSEGIVAGVGGGKFAPNATVTGSQFAKMLLIALGYSANEENFLGNAWEVNVNVKATQKGLYEDLETMDPSVALTRDNAAQMVWNALQAKEVKYEYTLVGSNGNLSSQVTVSDKGITLLADKYNTKDVFGMMTDASYDSDKDEYTYTVDGKNYVATQDYSDLFAMNVKVVTNTSKKEIYGIVANDSEVVVEGILGDIDDLDKIDATTDEVTVNDVDYDIDKGAVTGYYFLNGKIADIRDVIGGTKGGQTVAGMTGYEAFSFKAIDNDDNGKIDTIVVFPFTVKEVTFVGAKTFQAGTNYTIEDVNVYEGLAEDDYTIITAKANTLDNKDTFAKATVVTGEVTVANASKGEYTIDGTVYTVGNGVDAAALVLGDTVEAVVVNGYIFHAEKVSGIASLDEILFIDGAEISTSYGSSKYMAQAYDMKGTKMEIEVKSAEGKDLAGIGQNAKLLNGLWAFEIDDGEYELTAITVDTKDNSGKDVDGDFDKMVNNVATAGKDKIAGMRVNDDAVVFVVDKDGDVSVKTGATVADWSKTDVQSVVAYANETDGVAYVELAAIYMNANQDTPDADSDAIYAYVTKVLGQTKEDDTKYNSYTVWTATGEQTIKVKAANDFGAQKGSFVKFENSKLTAVDGAYNTITGIAGDNLYFKSANTYVITDDTQIVYINVKDVEGAEGALKVAVDLDGDGYKEDNVWALAETKANSDEEYEMIVLFVDVNNDIQKTVIK